MPFETRIAAALAREAQACACEAEVCRIMAGGLGYLLEAQYRARGAEFTAAADELRAASRELSPALWGARRSA